MVHDDDVRISVRVCDGVCLWMCMCICYCVIKNVSVTKLTDRNMCLFVFVPSCDFLPQPTDCICRPYAWIFGLVAHQITGLDPSLEILERLNPTLLSYTRQDFQLGNEFTDERLQSTISNQT